MKKIKNNPLARLPASNRLGAFLVVSMICLVLATALLGTLLKMVVLGRRYANTQSAGLQAEWLAESALDRAAAKLSTDPKYQGETWTISSQELDGFHEGKVAIEVSPSEIDHQRKVKVIATYPSDATPAVNRTKQIFVAVEAPENAPRQPSPAKAEKP